jgi:DNA-binding NarL/FixJ family response regulator
MGSSSRPRILIADDHTLIAEALKRLLDDEFEVVGIVPDGHRLIEAAQNFKPDVLIVDIGMPALNGLMAAQRIKRLSPSTKVIYLTVNQDTELMNEAFRTGASAFLSKKSAGSELLVALRTVLERGMYTSPGQQVDLSEQREVRIRSAGLMCCNYSQKASR